MPHNAQESSASTSAILPQAAAPDQAPQPSALHRTLSARARAKARRVRETITHAELTDLRAIQRTFVSSCSEREEMSVLEVGRRGGLVAGHTSVAEFTALRASTAHASMPLLPSALWVRCLRPRSRRSVAMIRTDQLLRQSVSPSSRASQGRLCAHPAKALSREPSDSCASSPLSSFNSRNCCFLSKIVVRYDTTEV